MGAPAPLDSNVTKLGVRPHQHFYKRKEVKMDRPECDFSTPTYNRCCWCHSVRSKAEMLYKNDNPFCSHEHLLEWEKKNKPDLQPMLWNDNTWLGGK